MNLRALLLVVAALGAGSVAAQPPGNRGTHEDIRADLRAAGAGTKVTPQDRAHWKAIEQMLDRELPSLDAARREGGKALENELDRLDRLAEMRPNALNCYLYGRLLGLTGSFEAARTQLKRALEFDPKFYWAWRGLGTTYAAQQLFEQAEHHYRRALELQPGDEGTRENLLIALIERSKYGAAETLALEGLRTSKDNASFHLHLARALMGENRWREAIPHLEFTIADKPEAPGLALWLARCQFFSGDVSAAESTIRARLDQEPRDWQAWNELARIMGRQGHLHVAGRALQKGAEHCPDPSRSKLMADRATELLAGPEKVRKRDENVKSIEELLAIASDPAGELDRRLQALRALSRVPYEQQDQKFLRQFAGIVLDDDAHIVIVVLKSFGQWASDFERIGFTESPYHRILKTVIPLIFQKRAMKEAELIRGIGAHLLGHHTEARFALKHLIGSLRIETNAYAFRETHEAMNRLTYAYIGVGVTVDESNLEELRAQWLAWWGENRARFDQR